MQNFCGECGTSLAGICPDGHPNPKGQRFCGECGQSLGQLKDETHLALPAAEEPKPDSARPPSESGITEPAQAGPSDLTARLDGVEATSDPSAIGAQLKQSATHVDDPDDQKLHIGDKLKLDNGIHATVVEISDKKLRLDVTKGTVSYGETIVPRRNVEDALASGKVAAAEHDRSGDPQGTVQGNVREENQTNSSGSPSEAAATAAPAPVSRSTERLKAWWPKLPSWGKLGAVVAVALTALIVALLGFGACGNSQYRQCVNDGMRALEYYQGGGNSATKDAIKRSCKRTFG